ncbi:flagellar hook assembly protein FlgD [Azospirillum halopraeferens]|uniref:flagellar hook assembly protein FlgD n=1 Tax=Azospirillum halopraeferens TaxID=34010 RepID=UPI0004048022|nr:flagellar hook capping FlgD N-terminal domain-containing protein [Azospirillum halopraeferens]
MSVDTNNGLSQYGLTPYGTARQNTTGASKTTDTRTDDEKKTDVALKGLGDNFTSFLRLLTTQMQNQDPLKPMDTNEMTNQLVQFANVEQNIATNSRLDKLIKSQQTAATASNLSYLGRVVEYEGDVFPYIQGMEKAELSYELDRAAEKVRIDILDSKGRIVRSMPGATDAGKQNDVVWDFKDDQGIAVPPGNYRINVAPSGKSADDHIKATTTTYGYVAGIDYSKSGEPMLAVAQDLQVPVSSIKRIH